eukprot:TRINITY_DN14115_c0_g2_i1.p1 TRINITY_DN14115_c0_g2~~TRINITY_DN14115_c0_g2_i1.p1  ORF type:complete len:361 (+),score=43.27 TRINITY_DN14115_c0_g2_i1:105-1085(+)
MCYDITRDYYSNERQTLFHGALVITVDCLRHLLDSSESADFCLTHFCSDSLLEELYCYLSFGNKTNGMTENAKIIYEKVTSEMKKRDLLEGGLKCAIAKVFRTLEITTESSISLQSPKLKAELLDLMKNKKMKIKMLELMLSYKDKSVLNEVLLKCDKRLKHLHFLRENIKFDEHEKCYEDVFHWLQPGFNKVIPLKLQILDQIFSYCQSHRHEDKDFSSERPSWPCVPMQVANSTRLFLCTVYQCMESDKLKELSYPLLKSMLVDLALKTIHHERSKIVDGLMLSIQMELTSRGLYEDVGRILDLAKHCYRNDWNLFSPAPLPYH